MKKMLHLKIALPALAVLIFCSEIRAETFVQIRLTLVPAVSVDSTGPKWTPCRAVSASAVEGGEIVHAIVRHSEEDGRRNRNPWGVPGQRYPKPKLHPPTGDRSGGNGGTGPRPTPRVNIGVNQVAPLFQDSRAVNRGEMNRSVVTPHYRNSEILSPLRGKLIRPTIEGGDAVVVVPIGMPAQDGVVPYYRQVAVRLNIILPSAYADPSGTSPVKVKFQSVPLEQSQQLPPAMPVLKRPRIAEESMGGDIVRSQIMDAIGH